MAAEGILADQITGISSMATRRILGDLVGAYGGKTGRSVFIESVGGVDAARRVREGEMFDVVVLAAEPLGTLEAQGHILAGSRVGFAKSPMAAAIRSGVARPDMSSQQSFRRALAEAGSIGYSTGPSGSHLLNLLKSWGLDELASPRIVQAPPGVPVGALLARGDADIGIQQLSELMHEPGIDIVGVLPPAIQSMTLFSIGIGARSSKAAEARAFIAYLASAGTDEVKRRHGMEPA
jgi:molybdate transport system substrate-binding protein